MRINEPYPTDSPAHNRAMLRTAIHCPAFHHARLNGARSRRPVVAREQPVPGLEPQRLTASVSCLSSPDLRRCEDTVGAVRADVVVPEAEEVQSVSQFRPIGYLPIIQLAFEGAEEALDTPVLPGTGRVGALMLDAEPEETETKQAAGEHPLVIGAQATGPAIVFDQIQQASQQREAGFVGQCLQRETGAASVFEDTEESVIPTGGIAFTGEIQGPDEIVRDRSWLLLFQFFAQHGNLVLITADEITDIGLAHRHAPMGMAAVEDLSEASAAGLGHAGFQAQDLPPDPGRLRWSAMESGPGRMASPAAADAVRFQAEKGKQNEYQGADNGE